MPSKSALLICENPECDVGRWAIAVDAYWTEGGARCPECRRPGKVAWSGSWNVLVERLFR